MSLYPGKNITIVYMSPIASRKSPREMSNKKRYLEDRHNLGEYPLANITGLHYRDRLELEQHVRMLTALARLRNRPTRAGYTKKRGRRTGRRTGKRAGKRVGTKKRRSR